MFAKTVLILEVGNEAWNEATTSNKKQSTTMQGKELKKWQVKHNIMWIFILMIISNQNATQIIYSFNLH